MNTTTMLDVAVIGSIVSDTFVEAELEQITRPEAPTSRGGLLLPLGEKRTARSLFSTLGGNAANASVTFARQGLRTAIVSRIGDDLAGRELCETLEREGVSTARVTRDPRLATAASLVFLCDGERSIVSYSGAAERLSLSPLDLGRLRARYWYVSLPGRSYTLLPRILSAARRSGVLVALNPSTVHLTEGRTSLLSSLSRLAILVLNTSEAALLTGVTSSSEREIFDRLDELVPGVVAVTDGPRGVSVSDGRLLYRAGVFPERRLVDRTGAGDAFGSGFVAGLAATRETCVRGSCSAEAISYAIRLGSANATSVVEHLGATAGILLAGSIDTLPRFRTLPIEIERRDQSA